MEASIFHKPSQHRRRFSRAACLGGVLLAVTLLAAPGCRTAIPVDNASAAAGVPVRLSQAPRTDREQALPLAVE